MTNILKHLISSACNEAGIDDFEIIEHCSYITSFSIDIIHNGDVYFENIEFLECEDSNYLITESDIEVMHRHPITIPHQLKHFIIKNEVHDWFNQMHYHIVSIKSINYQQLKKVLNFFLTIYKYVNRKKEIQLSKEWL